MSLVQCWEEKLGSLQRLQSAHIHCSLDDSGNNLPLVCKEFTSVPAHLWGAGRSARRGSCASGYTPGWLSAVMGVGTTLQQQQQQQPIAAATTAAKFMSSSSVLTLTILGR